MDTRPVYPKRGKEISMQIINAKRSKIEAICNQRSVVELRCFQTWCGTGWPTKFKEIGENDDGVLELLWSTSKHTYKIIIVLFAFHAAFSRVLIWF